MCEFRIEDLALQSIEFNVTKDLAAVGEIILQRNQKTLLNEKQKLNELHLRVWNDENTICNDVWKFNQEYNFYTIIKEYGDAAEKHTENKKRHEKDIEWDTSIREVNYEIEAIEREIRSLMLEKDLTEKNLKKALEHLEAEQSFSKENSDIKSLLRAIESSRQEILDTECEIEKYMKIKENTKITSPTTNLDIKNEKPSKNCRKNIFNNQTNTNDNNNIIVKKKRKKNIPLQKSMSKSEYMTPVTVVMNDDVEINTIKNKYRPSSEEKDLSRKSSYFEKNSSRVTKISGNSIASSDQTSFIAASYEKHNFITAKTILKNNNSIKENSNENRNTVQHAVCQNHVTPVILSPSSFLIALKNTVSTENYNNNEFSNSHQNTEIDEFTKQSNNKTRITSGKYVIKKRSIISLKLAERQIKACRSKVVQNN